MDTTTQDALRAVAHKLADAARVESLRYFRSADLAADTKLEGGFDPVTAADRAAEQAMREILAAERPEDGIVGEEFPDKDSQSGLTWVLDPIDGTRAYISGTPTWGTLVALHDGVRVVFGMIDQPYIGERFCGGLGMAGFDGPKGARGLGTSKVATLAEATVFTTFPEVGSAAEGAAFHAVASQCKLTRYGMDCYAYGLLALGQVELVIEAGLAPYDIQGPIGVIEAAGGIVTTWQGGPADQGGRVLAAANADIHAAALEVLSRHG